MGTRSDPPVANAALITAATYAGSRAAHCSRCSRRSSRFFFAAVLRQVTYPLKVRSIISPRRRVDHIAQAVFSAPIGVDGVAFRSLAVPLLSTATRFGDVAAPHSCTCPPLNVAVLGGRGKWGANANGDADSLAGLAEQQQRRNRARRQLHQPRDVDLGLLGHLQRHHPRLAADSSSRRASTIFWSCPISMWRDPKRGSSIRRRRNISSRRSRSRSSPRAFCRAPSSSRRSTLSWRPASTSRSAWRSRPISLRRRFSR